MSSGEHAPRAAGCSVRKSANVYTVKYRFIGSPSSSLALQMLGAVYLALLFHPPDLPLTLCTDSLFTLQQLQWLTAQQVRPASYLSMSCRPYCR